MTLYMLTHHRRKVEPSAIHADTLDLRDIAHALAKLPRYNGHGPIDLHYSVAEHSVMMANYAFFDMIDRRLDYRVAASFALAVLLHDANEAYMGDLTRAAKQAAGPDYKLACDHIQYEINLKFDCFGTAAACASEIKSLDARILLNERPIIYPGSPPWAWEHEYDPLPFVGPLPCWPAKTARDLFIGHFMILAQIKNHGLGNTAVMERL